MIAQNSLGDETSPYLLQHKDNPVHWQAWSAATLDDARREDKPILLSIGYAACHWCHVMAHESFENTEIAALMNERFINVKVDREERPDLDAIYQHALSLLGEQGGWPLTMFLTPDGEPFWGGTYFPPASRWGRPGFPDVLTALSDAYRNDREKVLRNVTALRQSLVRLRQPQGGGEIALDLMDEIAQRLLGETDAINGGIGDAPKFPHCAVFELIWRAWRRNRDDEDVAGPLRRAVLRAVDGMCQGGIYDHLGGGFARYSTDARWLAPHFEKMLYDNAELIDLLTLVWQETRSPLHAARIAETIDWVRREMVTPGGGFASSLDADSEHVEGKFYIWTETGIDHVLGDHAALFKAEYDVTPQGNWEGHVILNRLRRTESPQTAEGAGDPAVEAELAACRARLLAARGARIRPATDDKVLADWNGLMIAALANAGQVFHRADWIDLAADAFSFILRAMALPGDRLAHSWRAGRARHPATIDDYANLCRAALALHEATGEAHYLDRAEAWIATLDRHYRDGDGAYFFAADDTSDLITRVKTAHDAAVPAGNGTLVGVLARLYYLTGDETMRLRAEEIIRTFSGELQRNFFPLATLLNGNEILASGLQVVILGRRGEARTEALLRAVHGTSLPNRILAVVAPEATLPRTHPAFEKTMVEGRPTAYVCQGPICSLPLTDPAALADDLRGR